MRLSAKIGLYTAVLATVVGGTGAWTLTDKAVAVTVDGQVRTVHTRSGTVGGALKQAHLSVAQHDVVAPALNASIHDGSKVVLRRGRELQLDVDGRSRDVWTTAATVDQALGELGYGTGKTVSVSRATRLPLTLTQLTLLTPKRITIHAGTKAVTIVTTERTVAGALAAAHILLVAGDRVSVPVASVTTTGQLVVVQHYSTRLATKTVKVDYPKKIEKVNTRLRGTTVIVQDGKKGTSTQTIQFVYVDGKLVGQRLLKTEVVHKPVTQITEVGTKKPVKKSSSDSDGSTSSKSSSGKSSSSKSSSSKSSSSEKSKKSKDSGNSDSDESPAPTGSGGSPKSIAAELLNSRGWGGNQYSCLVKLWNRESGWRVHAHNGSGAYGIPQALPGSKMSSAGPNWQDNARTQIKWGLGYISGRYGNPCGAWGHSQSSGWY